MRLSRASDCPRHVICLTDLEGLAGLAAEPLGEVTVMPLLNLSGVGVHGARFVSERAIGSILVLVFIALAEHVPGLVRGRVLVVLGVPVRHIRTSWPLPHAHGLVRALVYK